MRAPGSTRPSPDPGQLRRRGFLPLAAAAVLAPRPARSEPAPVVQVADGVYVRRGLDAEATPDNRDAIATVGFVVGGRSVAVIDPGGSRADGEALRAAVRAATPLPISHLILTHCHPDHILGCVAFAPDAPHVVAHARMLPSLRERGDFYRTRLAETLGATAAGDYATPDILVQDRATIDLGDRSLQLQAHRTAHTDNDLTALDTRTGTLWAGDLLFVGRVPAVDGSILGWLDVIRTLRALPASRAVPGHGPETVPWPGALDDEERYLNLLVREIRAAIAHGGSMEQAVAQVGQSERGRWSLFDEYNGRNVTTAFKELEWE